MGETLSLIGDDIQVERGQGGEISEDGEKPGILFVSEEGLKS